MPQFPCPHCGALFDVRARTLPNPPQARAEGAIDRFKLSPRSREAALLMLDGMTNQEIADVMGLKLQVVKNRVSTIFEVVGCSNRAEFVSMVLLGRQA